MYVPGMPRLPGPGTEVCRPPWGHKACGRFYILGFILGNGPPGPDFEGFRAKAENLIKTPLKPYENLIKTLIQPFCYILGLILENCNLGLSLGFRPFSTNK